MDGSRDHLPCGIDGYFKIRSNNAHFSKVIYDNGFCYIICVLLGDHRQKVVARKEIIYSRQLVPEYRGGPN